MWGNIMISMYRLWLHGLYGPRCPLSPERLLNLITHTLPNLSGSNVLMGKIFIWVLVLLKHWLCARLWHLHCYCTGDTDCSLALNRQCIMLYLESTLWVGVGGFSKMVANFKLVDGSFNLFMTTTWDVWIIPSFQIWDYLLHVEHISCVITNCGQHQWVIPSLSIPL